MKIKETIERECCEVKDLRRMTNEGRPVGRPYFFCIHCGRHWEDLGMEITPGSDLPSGLQRMAWPWERIK